MSHLRQVDHPVLQRSLTALRRRETPQQVFREELHRASVILAAEALTAVSTRSVSLDTPLETADGFEFDRGVVLVPILRAGLAMVDAFLSLVPDARIGHVGLYRDESTHAPVDYYLRLPADLDRSLILVLDPMLATGGSAERTVTEVKKAGARDVVLVCVIAAPEGVARMADAHPDVSILTAALDRGLDANAFIRPGLGDAGDRAFGTE